MRLNLRELFEVTGLSRTEEHVIGLEPNGRYVFSPVKVRADFSNRAGVVGLDYTVSFDLTAECDRCLAQINRHFDMRFSHILQNARSPQQETGYDDNGHIILREYELDIEELAVGDIWADLPFVLHCRPDCKGLCHICGADLNVNPCECGQKRGDPRLQALRDLL